MNEFRPAAERKENLFSYDYVPKFTESQLRILAYGLTHGLKVTANFAVKVYGGSDEKAKQNLLMLESWNAIIKDRNAPGWFIVKKEACPPKAWDLARHMARIEKQQEAEVEAELCSEEERITDMLTANSDVNKK